jgi:glycogen operon protein
MGDEVGQSQSGNNNAYCQDNELTWLRWTDHDPRQEAFFEFLRGVVRIRRTRPLLGQSRFLHGDTVPGRDFGDVRWLRPDGEAMQQGDWDQPITHSLAMLLSGDEERLLLLLNAHYEAVVFRLSAKPLASGWRMLIDTVSGAATPGNDLLAKDERMEVPGRSLILLESRA